MISFFFKCLGLIVFFSRESIIVDRVQSDSVIQGYGQLCGERVFVLEVPRLPLWGVNRMHYASCCESATNGWRIMEFVRGFRCGLLSRDRQE